MYILGGTTLPNPQGFSQKPLMIAQDVTTLSGATKRDYVRKKYKYILDFTMLTQAEVTTILTLYANNTVLSFSVTETNLTIPSVDVLMSISGREYNTPGIDYREDLSITLIEV